MIKLVDPAVTLLPDTMPNLERIEFCGRTCYNSREKIAPGTAKKFFEMIVHNGHESVLEHSNLVVKTLTDEATQNMREILQETEQIMGRPHYIRNCENSNVSALYCDNIWSGNLRAWRNVVKTFTGEALLYNLFGNSQLFEDIYLCYHRTVFGKDTSLFAAPDFTKRDRGILLEEDPEHRDEHKILTFDIVCDRAIANEIVRHRALSFSQQSTRYCNYSGEIHFVRGGCMMMIPISQKKSACLKRQRRMQNFSTTASWKKETSRNLPEPGSQTAWQQNFAQPVLFACGGIF